MNKYQTFIFENYQFDQNLKTLELSYSLDEKLYFKETYKFDFDFINFNQTALDRALQLLFFVAGVSYFKTYLPTNIIVKSGQIDAKLADFLNKTYTKGLAEFFYVNNLDPNTRIAFPINSSEILNTLSIETTGLLTAVGGGKDSLVSLELLDKAKLETSTFSLNHRIQLEPLIKRIGNQHFWVDRTWDKKLYDLKNDPDAYNGHVPISAIFACVGTIIAILTGKKDIIMSNESSADEPTLQYRNVQVNHQYSKSSEFEADFQQLLKHYYGDNLRYYSLLRPLNELQIAKIFARTGFDKYKDVFSSCNRAFTSTSNRLFWDGKCSKCAFVYLVLAPFITENELISLFGHNLLLGKDLDNTYRELVGLTHKKPLECVGTTAESLWAMAKLSKTYPELNRFISESKVNNDIFDLKPNLIPKDISEQITYN